MGKNYNGEWIVKVDDNKFIQVLNYSLHNVKNKQYLCHVNAPCLLLANHFINACNTYGGMYPDNGKI